MMMYKALYPGDDTDRRYVGKKKGGRGFASFEDSKDASIRGLENRMKKSKERLITAGNNNTDNINRTTITRKQKWEEK